MGQSQSSEAPSQRGHNAPRTDSRASREQGYEPRPQAPHPTPLLTTSHEDALERMGWQWVYSHIGIESRWFLIFSSFRDGA